MEYYWMNKYDIMTSDSEDYLIFKKLGPTGPTVRIIPREQYFDILSEVHKSCGHGGRDKILNLIKTRFYIPKKAVEIFVSLCPTCETKRSVPRKAIGTKPIIVTCNFNLRGQVNLIDFQSCPDGEFKWLLSYQDNTTKFQNLRPLKTKTAVEVASELTKIFLIFGAPYILQSDNGREFTANVIKQIVIMWPECKIVCGSTHHSQSQGSIEKSDDVENMVQAWMTENKSTNWSLGCYFVQYSKNALSHHIIGKSPYKALFGRNPKAGLNGSDIPTSIIATIETEEELNNFIEVEPFEAVCTADSDNSDNKSKISMENVDESNSKCVVCHNDAPGGHKCEYCNNIEHVTCRTEEGEECSDLSVLCKVELLEDITIEKNKTHKGLKRVAEEMIDNTKKKMPNLEMGDSVIVSVPKVDRGPLDIKSIQGIIVDIRNGVYRVGTKNGTIKNWFSRQDLQYSDISYGEDIAETPITLREVVTSQTLFGGQGFQKCNCKPAVNQCRNNRCACFKNKILCGAKCHGSVTCVNK